MGAIDALIRNDSSKQSDDGGGLSTTVDPDVISMHNRKVILRHLLVGQLPVPQLLPRNSIRPAIAFVLVLQPRSIWLLQVECQFELAGIGSQWTKFRHVGSVLPQEVGAERTDLLVSPSSANPYDALLSLDELGDYRPSHSCSGVDTPYRRNQSDRLARLQAYFEGLSATVAALTPANPTSATAPCVVPHLGGKARYRSTFYKILTRSHWYHRKFGRATANARGEAQRETVRTATKDTTPLRHNGWTNNGTTRSIFLPVVRNRICAGAATRLTSPKLVAGFEVKATTTIADMLRFKFIALFFFIVVSRAQDNVLLANNYLDSVLSSVQTDRSLLAAIDPLRVADFGEENYRIHGGEVVGLSSFYRNGNSTIHYTQDEVLVMAPMIVRSIMFFGRHRYSKYGVTIKGDIEAKVESVEILITYRAPRSGGDAKLESFQVESLKGLQVTKITGMSRAFNWLLRIVANRVARQFQGKIEGALEEEASKFISSQVDKKSFPPMSGPPTEEKGTSFPDTYPPGPF
ncbi:uncharacterized protein LOC135386859 [Ornithodoros turicata]|uniref:uncharacterized protein LOC135386859 n=1 Tax=Ornithodoros turicata TaxID=34597 RepID=UPI003138CD90